MSETCSLEDSGTGSRPFNPPRKLVRAFDGLRDAVTGFRHAYTAIQDLFPFRFPEKESERTGQFVQCAVSEALIDTRD